MILQVASNRRVINEAVFYCVVISLNKITITMFLILKGTVDWSLRAWDYWSKISHCWKCWDDPPSLYSRAWGLNGPRKFDWIKELHGVLHGMQWIMFHGLLYFCVMPTLKRVGSNWKPGDHDTPKSHNPWFITAYCVEGPTWIGWYWHRIGLRAPVVHVIKLHLKACDTKFKFNILGYGLQVSF